MASSNDHRACQIRYRDLLGRLADMTQRIEQLEDVQREVVELLRDFRDLGRALAVRIERQDRQLHKLAVRRLSPPRNDETIARHFRN